MARPLLFPPAAICKGRLSRAGLDAILPLLAEKESRPCNPPPDTPLMPLDADPGEVAGEVGEQPPIRPTKR